MLLSRRQILIAAGATVGFGGRGTWAAADDDLKIVPREFPEPPPDFPGCGNIPTGGPFYPQAPGAGDLRTKAGFDRDRVWPIGQEVVVRYLTGKGRRDPWVETIKAKVGEIARMWSAYANLTFRFIESGPCHMTVNFYPFTDRSGQCTRYGLFNCLIGQDTFIYRDKVSRSMNLLFDPLTQYTLSAEKLESEFHRLILHEFGHAIGLIHEHQRRDEPIVWMSNLYAYAKENWGWEKKDVDEQLVNRQNIPNLVGSVSDQESIMTYPTPLGLAYYQLRGPGGDLATDANKVPVPDYSRPFAPPYIAQLSPLDKASACVTYPFEMTPSGADPLTPAKDPKPVPGVIERPGQVVGYRFAAKAGDSVTIKTEGPDPVLVALLKNANQPSERGALANIVAAYTTEANGTGSRQITLPEKASGPGIYFIEVRANPPRSRKARTNFSISVAT